MSSTDDTRTLILNAAKELFAAKGFNGTSVRDIVKAAGVNISLVSYHFGGKDALYRECIKQAGTNRLTIAREIFAPASSAKDMRAKISSYIERALTAFASDLATQKIIARELDLGRKVFGDLLQDIFLKIHQTVWEFLTECQNNGWIRKGLDCRLIASMMQGLVINEVRLEEVKKSYFGPSIKDPEHRAECAKHISAMILDGVVA